MTTLCEIHESSSIKLLCSAGYNYVFRKADGFFARWGETTQEDPDFSPVGPEIADIEISTVCSGPTGKPCSFCYKANTSQGENMSLETFQKVLATLPRSVVQVALGLGDIDANPDLWSILSHCRERGVIPNVTINGARMDEDRYGALANLCGAVAVSRYEPRDVCYNAVEALSRHGLRQVNIHQLLAEETYESCLELLDEAKTDPRLRGLRAVVFLALKQVRRGRSLTPLRDVAKYKRLVEKAFQLGVGVGFDSCSAPMFLKAMEGHRQYKQYEMLAEPCESMLFSIYIDVRGQVYPCSFMEDQVPNPIDLTKVKDFHKEVWYAESTKRWRERLLGTACGGLVEGCRQCPAFDIY
jgi:radical SAM protein with 4Fe4S-binding SPASM domain